MISKFWACALFLCSPSKLFCLQSRNHTKPLPPTPSTLPDATVHTSMLKFDAFRNDPDRKPTQPGFRVSDFIKILCFLGKRWIRWRKKNNLETVTKNLIQALKYLHCKKSAILLQLGWFSGNLFYSWARHFDQVSWLQNKNYQFFTMNIF